MFDLSENYSGSDFFEEKIRDEKLLSSYLSRYFDSLNKTILKYYKSGLVYDTSRFTVLDGENRYDRLEVILVLWYLSIYLKYNSYLFKMSNPKKDEISYLKSVSNEIDRGYLDLILDRAYQVYPEIKSTIKERSLEAYQNILSRNKDVLVTQIDSFLIKKNFIGSYAINIANEILKLKKELNFKDSIKQVLKKESIKNKNKLFDLPDIKYEDSLYGISFDNLDANENLELLENKLDSDRNLSVPAIAMTETQTYVDDIQYIDYGLLSGYYLLLSKKTYKKWNSVSDSRTRPAHREANGQEVGINEKFIVMGEELDSPRDFSGSPSNTVNCRCWTTFEVK